MQRSTLYVYIYVCVFMFSCWWPGILCAPSQSRGLQSQRRPQLYSLIYLFLLWCSKREASQRSKSRLSRASLAIGEGMSVDALAGRKESQLVLVASGERRRQKERESGRTQRNVFGVRIPKVMAKGRTGMNSLLYIYIS